MRDPKPERGAGAAVEHNNELAAALVAAGCARKAPGVFDLPPAVCELSEVSDADHTLVVTISTATADRHGDVMRPEGARLERFRRNPVVLYNHDYDGLPVGKSLWEKVGPKGITAKPSFHLQTELSREVWTLVQKRILNAWSVGFLPEDWGPLEGDDEKEKRARAGSERGGGEAFTRAGAAVGITGFEVRAWDLLEYSCVPVPANFEALTSALKDARITAPALVKSLGPLGFRAPDLVPSQVRPEDRRARKGKESDMDPAEVTLEWLEAEKPELVGKLKSQGAEEEAAKAALEAEKAEKEKTKSEQSARQSDEEKLAAARDDGAEAERGRLKALKEAFPDKPEFALEQFEAGASLERAQDAYRDLRLAELERENAKLKTALPPGAEPVGFDGVPDEKTHVERAHDYQAEHGGAKECSITEALRKTAVQRR